MSFEDILSFFLAFIFVPIVGFYFIRVGWKCRRDPEYPKSGLARVIYELFDNAFWFRYDEEKRRHEVIFMLITIGVVWLGVIFTIILIGAATNK